MLNKQVSRGMLHRVRVAIGTPSITHLLFADDCFLFFRANELKGTLVGDILIDYVAASG